MHKPEDPILLAQDELADVDPTLLFKGIELISSTLAADDIDGELEDFSVLQKIAYEVGQGFRREIGPALDVSMRPSFDLNEAFDFGVLHMCLAFKLAADRGEGNIISSSNPEAIETGFELLGVNPDTDEIIEDYCSSPLTLQNSAITSIDVLGNLVQKYGRLVHVVPMIAELAPREVEREDDDDEENLKNIAAFGAAVTLSALDNVFKIVLKNIAEKSFNLSFDLGESGMHGEIAEFLRGK